MISLAITLRPATAADQKRITAIIREAGINPMDLKWHNFMLAVDEASGEVVGTAQIKTHRDGSRELASIATLPAYQGQGIATQLIEFWLASDAGPLYLTCRAVLGPFYERFGFRGLSEKEMPPYFRRLKKLVKVFEVVAGEEQLLVMKRESES
jgi:N-acetylglutamate synthase-like GNAT family acetyltransferase